MKKLLAIVISFLICFSVLCFSACGNTKEFEELVFMTRSVYYDGTSKNDKMSVLGLPEGANVVYVFVDSESGQTVDSAIEVGIYEVMATVSKKGYKTTILTSTLTIKSKSVEPDTPDLPSDNPYLNYSEISTDTFLYDLNGKTSIDLKEILADKTKTELEKYASAKWYLTSVGNVNGNSVTFTSSEILPSQVNKEQYKVEVLATTKENQTRTLFKGTVDFYDYKTDGFVWNVMNEDILNYITYRHVQKGGVTFEENLHYDGIIEGGSCISMKDSIFDYSDEEIQEEIDRRIYQIQNDTTTPKLTGITYLNCVLMIRPLHSKAYYEHFMLPSSKLSLGVVLYCEQEESADSSRNLNDFNGGSKNNPTQLNEWFKIDIRIDALLEKYDTFISDKTPSCGRYTALLGLQTDQLSYCKKVEDINVLKVEVLINELEII